MVNSIIVALFAFVCPLATAQTLVFNGHFDLFGSGWRQGEEARTSQGGIEGGEVEGLGGTIGDGDDYGRLSQTVQVVPNSDYTLSASISVRNGKAGQAGVAVGGTAGNYNVADATQTLLFDYVSTTTDHQPVSLSFNSGADNEVTIFFDAGDPFDASEPIGDLRFDNIVLDGPAPADYVDPYAAFDWAGWEIEGHHPAVPSGGLLWNPIRESHVTPNGDGFRHEVKTQQDARVDIKNQFESLSYTGTIDFSNGVESIVTQWHPNRLGYLAALHISDVSQNASRFFTNGDVTNGERWLSFTDTGGDGVANNGIFDVFVVAQHPDLYEAGCTSGYTPVNSYGDSQEELVMHFGTIRSGESLDVYVENDHGEFEFRVTIGGTTKTATFTSAPSTTSFLKFGSYDQARDMNTLERVLDCDGKASLSFPERHQVFTDWYAARPNRRSSIEMTNIQHTREIDVTVAVVVGESSDSDEADTSDDTSAAPVREHMFGLLAFCVALSSLVL